MKKMGILIGIMIGLMIGFSFKTLSKFHSNQQVSGKEFVNRLESLGYFKYAKQDDIVKLKNNLAKNYDPNNELVTLWDDFTGTPLDYRYYGCDGEAVFEQDGFTDMLNELDPTFKKIGLKIKITNHVEEWDNKNKWLNHRITINGTEYIIFKNFKGFGWGEAVVRLAQIINLEAEKQSIDERIYLASGGNDGRLIFLTTELYEYIYLIYKNRQWKPLMIEEWMKEMDVKPMNLQ